MTTMDPQYDEVRGNPALPQCMVSFARDEDFFLATKDVLGWSDPVGGAANYAVIPIVRVEAMFRSCKVDLPANTPIGGLVDHCLHLYIKKS